MLLNHSRAREQDMSQEARHTRAKFSRMDQASPLDWALIATSVIPFAAGLPERLLQHLRLLEGDYGGFAIDRLEHCLQTATRAANDGRSDEYIVCALFHDFGDLLGTYNHADLAAAVLEPFVSEQNHWMVKHHSIFQGYYYFQYLGLNRNMRDQYREHKWYDYTLEFCEKYDQVSFDPKFKSMRLADFEPIVKKLFRRPKRSIYLK